MQQTARDRLVLGGSPCTYFYAPDNRKITDKKVARGARLGLPLQGRDPRQRPDPGRQRDPDRRTSCLRVSPAVRRTTRSRATATSRPTRPRPRSSWPTAATQGFEIKFLFRTDPTLDVARSRTPRQGADRGRLQGHPGADHDRPNYVGRPRQRQGRHQRPLLRLVLRLAVRCDLDPDDLPVDRPRRGRASAPTSPPSTSRRSTPKIDAVFRWPLADQPAAWNDLDKEIMTKYLPVVPRYYGGVAQTHGSKIQGTSIDNTLGHADLQEHLVEQ